jgi:SAM-dependent methyltransferase
LGRRRKSAWTVEYVSEIFLWKNFFTSNPAPKGVEPRVPPRVQTSEALKVFLNVLAGEEQPAILDLGGVKGDNIQFFCNHGFKVHVFDLLQTLPRIAAAAKEENAEESESSEDELYEKMMREFNYPDNSLAGVLCWDVLDHLESRHAHSFIQRINRSMKDGGLLLSFFSMRKTNENSEGWNYRIMDREHVEFLPKETKIAARHNYHNGEIIKLFKGFKVLYFYFLRSNFREILVRKPTVGL